MNTSCPQIRRLLVEYLYEELPEDQAALVRLHLEQCPPCREEFELCQRLLATIDTASRADASANPTAGLLQRINWQIDHQPLYRQSRKSSIFTTRVLALAASFLFGIFAAPFLFQWYSSRESASFSPEGARPMQGHLYGAPGLNSGARSWRAPHLENGQIPEIDWEMSQREQPGPTPMPTPEK